MHNKQGGALTVVGLLVVWTILGLAGGLAGFGISPAGLELKYTAIGAAVGLIVPLWIWVAVLFEL